MSRLRGENVSAFDTGSSFVLLVPGQVAAEAAKHRFGDVALESANTPVDAAVDADADAASLETVLLTTLVRGRAARRIEKLAVLLEESVGDLLGRVPSHILV